MNNTNIAAREMTKWILAGRMDNQNRTPWKNAPMTEQQWAATGIETPEQLAYWDGFNGACLDAVHAIIRKAKAKVA